MADAPSSFNAVPSVVAKVLLSQYTRWQTYSDQYRFGIDPTSTSDWHQPDIKLIIYNYVYLTIVYMYIGTRVYKYTITLHIRLLTITIVMLVGGRGLRWGSSSLRAAHAFWGICFDVIHTILCRCCVYAKNNAVTLKHRNKNIWIWIWIYILDPFISIYDIWDPLRIISQYYYKYAYIRK